jgi:hypothetical protein
MEDAPSTDVWASFRNDENDRRRVAPIPGEIHQKDRKRVEGRILSQVVVKVGDKGD